MGTSFSETRLTRDGARTYDLPMNINDATEATYTTAHGEELPATFFNYCDVNGKTDEQGGYALVTYTLIGEVVPSVRIVERSRINLTPKGDYADYVEGFLD